MNMNVNIIHRRDREKTKISMDSFKDHKIIAPPPSPTNITTNVISNTTELSSNDDVLWADKVLTKQSLTNKKSQHNKHSKKGVDLEVEEVEEV
jgi:hypothetical protein